MCAFFIPSPSTDQEHPLQTFHTEFVRLKDLVRRCLDYQKELPGSIFAVLLAVFPDKNRTCYSSDKDNWFSLARYFIIDI